MEAREQTSDCLNSECCDDGAALASLRVRPFGGDTPLVNHHTFSLFTWIALASIAISSCVLGHSPLRAPPRGPRRPRPRRRHPPPPRGPCAPPHAPCAPPPPSRASPPRSCRTWSSRRP